MVSERLAIKSARSYHLDLHIVITGERAWACEDLAMVIVQRLIARYGADIVVVHGGCPGVDESFNKACKSLDIGFEVRLATRPQTGTLRSEVGTES